MLVLMIFFLQNMWAKMDFKAKYYMHENMRIQHGYHFFCRYFRTAPHRDLSLISFFK